MKTTLFGALFLIGLQGCGGGKSAEPAELGHLIISPAPPDAPPSTATQVSVIGAPVIMFQPKPATTTITASTTTTTSIPTTTTITPATSSALLRIEREGDTWEYAVVVTDKTTSVTEEGRLTKRIVGKISNAAGAQCLIEETTGALTSTSTAIQRHIKESVYFAQDETGARFDCGFLQSQFNSIFIRYANINVAPQSRRIEAIDGFGGAINSPLISGSTENWMIYYWDFNKGAIYEAREYNIAVSKEKTATVPLGSFVGWEIDTTITTNGSDSISDHIVDFIVPEIGTISRERTVYSTAGEVSVVWDYRLESGSLSPL